MKYVEMTIEEALRYCKGNVSEKVLVAVYDLSDANGIAAFQQKRKSECEDIISQAETIAKECDNFINALKCFSEKQDLRMIQPRGVMTTILFHPRE